MSEECPACGADLDAWAEVANEADLAIMEIGKRMYEARDKWNIPHGDFLEALMAGFLTGAVAVGFTITLPRSRDEIMDYLREYLDTARRNYEISEAEADAEGMLQ